MKQLHILNGDSTRTLFEQSSLEGDVIVWREMLCSGPCSYDVGSTSFFSERAQFLHTEYQISKDQYQKNFVQHFDTVNWQDYDEIILWFEYDLFCFINCIAVLSFLKRKQLHVKLSLVDVSDQQKENQFVGLGEMAIAEYPSVYQKRQTLDPESILLGDEIWSIYCGEEHAKLKRFLKVESLFFPKLDLVLKSHFERLPSSTSLSQIDLTILHFIKESNPTKVDVIRHLLSTGHTFGLGDLQWSWHIDRLDRLYDIEGEKININDLGEDLLNQFDAFGKYATLIQSIYNYRCGQYTLRRVFASKDS